MKTNQEIRAKLVELKTDVRLTYPPATVFENAPLALEQCSQESKINALEWVLGVPFSRFPLSKTKLPVAKG